MFKQTKNAYYSTGAAITTGLLLASSDAHAQATTGNNDFGKIAENITDSIASVPGLLTALSYLFGLLLGVLGVMKIKDHVENPTNTPLKDGAIRLAAGGALFALPIVFEAMFETIGESGTDGGATAAKLNKVEFNLN